MADKKSRNEVAANIPIPENEAERLQALLDYNILDTAGEELLDDLTSLASYLCDTPIALISLIDANRQWFKSKVGLDAKETPRNISFCQYAIMDTDTFIVEDATVHETFKDNPLVNDDPNVRFYAGYPLIDPNGLALGTLCVIDRVNRKLSPVQQKALETLGKAVVSQIVIRKEKHDLKNYETIFNLSLDLICIAGSDGYFKKVNPAFTKTLGWSSEELLAKPFADFIHPDDIESTLSVIERLSLGEETVDFHNRFRTKSDNFIVLNWMANPDPNTGEMFAIARDVTEKMKYEEELKEAKQNALTYAAAKEEFLANMSHEIRTPLNAVLGFTDLVLETDLTPEQIDYMSAVKSSGAALLTLINDILDLSKISAGKIHFESIPFNIKDEVNNVGRIVELSATERSNEVSIFMDAKLPDRVVGDPHRLRQILLNLVNNAIKFTEGGKVNIFVKEVGSDNGDLNIQFNVEDTGIGIPDEKQKAIFESFTQADSDTSRKYGGTGLGLTIVQNLVEGQGGSITLASTVGKGTTFTVELPFAKADGDEIEEPVANSGTGSSYDLEGLSVLLVEDNAMNQKLATERLSKWGCTIDVASNGQIGVEMAQNMDYNIILMDLQMPVMDGYEATIQLRKQGGWLSEVPIIAMTAHSVPDVITRSREVGMNDHELKPFDPISLEEKIFNLTRGKEKSVEGPTSADDNERIIDLAFLKGESMNEPEMLKELLHLFGQNCSEFMTDLRSFLASEDWGKVDAAIHKIKSNVSMIGSKELVVIVDELEARTKDKNVESMLDLVDQFTNQYKLVDSAIQQELNTIK